MQVVMVMFRAEGDKRSFSVTKDVTIIGRREDCDLRIPVSEVSRKHCRIIRDGDSLRAEDLGSSNGSFHNGQRISGSVELQPGDSVQVGPVVFVVQVDGVPPDDELAPFEDRAAHKLDDSLAEHPPMEAAHDPEEAAENLEILEETPPPEMELESAEEEPELMPLSEDSGAIALSDDPEPIALDLSDDHIAVHMDEHPTGHDEHTDEHTAEHANAHADEHAIEHAMHDEHHEHLEHHVGLSEDDLLLDLNAVEDAPKKH
jgi:pSer/pThr/pTyr-binding forkhead associated (FHA) protein